MNELVLNRPKEQIYRFRSYSIIVDDKHIADLQNDSQQTLSLDSNEITIQAKVGRLSSNAKNFEFNDKKNLKLNIQGNRYYSKAFTLFGLLLIAEIGSEYLLDSFQTTISIIHLLTLLVAFYVIYTITFGKDSWITISKTS
ncbi:hypothetical protein [Fodinibius sp. Rm-B-1B1-1]|uniref:hypothetical protein n=1 Tax=Fodinibius alkaliphilus TaxID=3140241 RepID=UPI00315A007C